MIDSVVNSIEKLVTEFSRTRLVVYLLAVCVITGLVLGYEAYSGHIRLNKLDRSARILERLADFEERASITGDGDLNLIKLQLKQDLKKISKPFSLSSQAAKIPAPIARGVRAFIPWFVLWLVIMASLKDKDDLGSMFIGWVIMAIAFSLLGMLVPDVPWPMINYFLYPLGHIIIVVSVLILWRNVKQKNDGDA